MSGSGSVTYRHERSRAHADQERGYFGVAFSAAHAALILPALMINSLLKFRNVALGVEAERP
jgi:hypothetical protein